MFALNIRMGSNIDVLAISFKNACLGFRRCPAREFLHGLGLIFQVGGVFMNIIHFFFYTNANYISIRSR